MKTVLKTCWICGQTFPVAPKEVICPNCRINGLPLDGKES